jgi:predicted HNH restriction endonuclease
MAFRDGTNGPSLWDNCRQLSLAAIEYSPVDDIDLSRYPKGEPEQAWSQLKPTQRASLRRFVYEMKKYDVIYVKEGRRIVCKGVVDGPYEFDQQGHIKSSSAYWRHQRRVQWDPEFPELICKLGTQQIATVKPLTEEEVTGIEELVRSRVSGNVLSRAGREVADLDEEYFEGRELLQLHRRKERNRIAVQRKKEQVLAGQGKLFCEVCDFDFAEVYGPLGEGFAECHHRIPLVQLTEEHRTRLSELANVCANCHRMLHRRSLHTTVEGLRKIVMSRRGSG